jgi:lipopolysaccharide export LptBFGC system permease protein LptF
MGRAPRTHGMPSSGGWAFGPQGERLYHYRVYDSDREEFQGLRVFTLDRSLPRILDHRFSERARWRGNHWELEASWRLTFQRHGTGIDQQTEEQLTRAELDPPDHFAGRELNLTAASRYTAEMTLPEINEQIETLSNRGYDVTHLHVAYHGKLSQAVTPVVMVLLGLPFAFRVGRRGSLYGIGVALLLVLVYWATYAIFNALGLESLLDPRVAAWAPNALFGMVGLYLILYVRT